jgi:hypothetical protein
MSPVEEIDQLLHRAEARLIRQRKHHVYRLKSGRLFVRPSTPSDHRGLRNNLSILRKLVRQMETA